MVTVIVCIFIIHILIGIAVCISKNMLRKELGLYDEAGGELYKIIRKRCLVIGCRNKAEVFFGWRSGVCKECYDRIFKSKKVTISSK